MSMITTTITQRRGGPVAVTPPTGHTIATIGRDLCAHVYAVESSISGGPYRAERGLLWVVTPDGIERVIEASSFGSMFPEFDRRATPRV